MGIFRLNLDLARWNMALSAAVGLLILVYFIVYACACPSPELIRAIILEIIIFVLVFFFKVKASGSKGARLENMVLQELSAKWGSLLALRRAGAVLVFSF